MTADKSMCMCFPWWMCSSMQITPVQWDCWVFCTNMEIASWPQPTNEAKGWLDVHNTVYMPYCQICRVENVTHWLYGKHCWTAQTNHRHDCLITCMLHTSYGHRHRWKLVRPCFLCTSCWRRKPLKNMNYLQLVSSLSYLYCYTTWSAGRVSTHKRPSRGRFCRTLASFYFSTISTC